MASNQPVVGKLTTGFIFVTLLFGSVPEKLLGRFL
jgi:hypothetical protein